MNEILKQKAASMKMQGSHSWSCDIAWKEPELKFPGFIISLATYEKKIFHKHESRTQVKRVMPQISIQG